MNITSVTRVYFSPTGTTGKILQQITEGIQAAKNKDINLTLPSSGAGDYAFGQDDFVVIGAPVYAGRIPATAVQRLKQIKGNKTPAAIIVVYGNRAFEDALLELSALVQEAGFLPVAAGAFIGEHSYSTAANPIAVGRPDAQDLARAKDFGARISKKMVAIPNPERITTLTLPGKFPYKDYGAWPEMSPVLIEDLCNLCGECAAACPTAAITVESAVLTEKKKCILCCACVKSCPLDARIMEEPMIKQIAQWLSKNFQERKEPEIFI